MGVDPQAQCESFQSEYLHDARPPVSRGHELRMIDYANGVVFPIVGCMVARQAHLTYGEEIGDDDIVEGVSILLRHGLEQFPFVGFVQRP